MKYKNVKEKLWNLMYFPFLDHIKKPRKNYVNYIFVYVLMFNKKIKLKKLIKNGTTRHSASQNCTFGWQSLESILKKKHEQRKI
jgi:hypothetical protein